MTPCKERYLNVIITEGSFSLAGNYIATPENHSDLEGISRSVESILDAAPIITHSKSIRRDLPCPNNLSVYVHGSYAYASDVLSMALGLSVALDAAPNIECRRTQEAQEHLNRPKRSRK